MVQVRLKRMREEAVLPGYAHAHDAGMDVYAAEEVVLAPGERTQVKTGLALALPAGYAGLIWDKSGLSHKHGLKTLGGVIDAGYRGEVLVGVINLGAEPYTVQAGEKIAQLLVQKIERADVVEVGELDETERGEDGFGSSGA